MSEMFPSGAPWPRPGAIEDDAALAPARARFRGLIVDRILHLEACRKLAIQGDTSALRQIRDLCHKIRGVSATLGFAEIGHYAAEVETLAETALKQAMPGPGAPDLIDAPLESLLAAMEAVLDG